MSYQYEKKALFSCDLVCFIAFLLLSLGFCQLLHAKTPATHSQALQSTRSVSNSSHEGLIKIATLNNFPPFSFRIKGKLMGFTIDYIKLLEEKTDLQFKTVQGTWKENLNKFKNGEVDLITAISYTKDRTSFTRYTDSYYLIPTVVYTQENSFDYQGVKDLEGKTVGIEEDVFYKEYLQKYPDIKIVEIEDTNKLLQQLSFGNIDAVITNINIGNYMIKKHMLENVQMVGRLNVKGIKDEDLRIGVRKELKSLHRKIQNGMNQISPREYKSLQDRWVNFTPSKLLQDSFLPKEYSLLKKHKSKYGGLRLGCHQNWYPVDFVSSANVHKGIVADIFSLISKTRDLSFVLQGNKSFQNSLAKLKNDKIDLIPAVVPSTKLRKEFLLTKPYMFLQLVITTRDNEIFIHNLDSIQGKQIGYIDRGLLGSFFKKKYPDLKFVDVETVYNGLKRVKSKVDYAFIGTTPSVTGAIQKHEFYNLEIAGALNKKLPIAAAVKKGNSNLLNIIQKSVESVSLNERKQAIERWISIKFEQKANYAIIWWIFAGSIVVLSIVFFWSRKIRSYNQKISEANHLLTEKNLELEKLTITDHLTRLYNRSKSETELHNEWKRFQRTKDPFSVIILDIDWFKTINDNYGHSAGDTVLRELADRIRERIRELDIPCRWGGEEFLIICPNTDAKGATKLAEDIRKDIQNFAFSVNKNITVSAGVAVMTRPEQEIEGLVQEADKWLYQAKKYKNSVKSPDMN